MTPGSVSRPPGVPRLHRSVMVAATAALRRIFGEGARAEQVVDETLRHQPKWGARDRRMFAGSVYDLVRWWRWFAWLAGVPEDRAMAPALSDADAGRIWTAYWLTEGHPQPEFPECLTTDPDALARRRRTVAPPAVQSSVPDWLYDAGAAAYGAAWPTLLTALNEPADVFLRANTLRVTGEALAARLALDGVQTAPVPGRPDSLRLTERRNLGSHPAVRDGSCEIQDAGSQEIAPFLLPEAGHLVIDACAGAGGKSLHLACLMQNSGRLIAMDVHAAKLAELERRAARARVTTIRTQRITSPDAFTRRAGTADRLLLDVPCSGLGVLRRHPDTKWKVTPVEIDRLCALQREILDTASVMLKPGGRLVYATCSILPCENEDQIRSFLARRPDDWTLEAECHLLPTEGNHDGFYMARLRKNA